MNPEDNEFVESLNCWEDNYDVITDNIQKLSGLLSLQIQLLQNITSHTRFEQEEKKYQRNVRHMTLEEQSISRLLNSFEQRFNVELSKLTEFNNKLDTLLTGQQVLVTRIAQIEEKLTEKEVYISSPISVNAEHNNYPEVGKKMNKHLYDLAEKISRRHPHQTMSDKEFTDKLTKILEPKIQIACKDEKGEIFTLEGTVQEDGSIVCEPMTESRTIVGWSLKKEEPKMNTKTDFQKVYKKNVKTNDYVLVGYIENNVVEFYSFNEKTKPFVPNLYDPNWYVIKDTVRSADGNVYPLFDGITPNFIEQHPINREDRSVMGFRAKNDRIVYYDYFIS